MVLKRDAESVKKRWLTVESFTALLIEALREIFHGICHRETVWLTFIEVCYRLFVAMLVHCRRGLQCHIVTESMKNISKP